MNDGWQVAFDSPEWVPWAAILAGLALVLVVWAYWRGVASTGVRLLAGSLKAFAIVALAVCLVEPMFRGVRPRPGANLFVIAADNSRSLRLRDPGQARTRAEQLAEQLGAERRWQTRLSQDFDVRRYRFDTQVQPLADFAKLDFAGEGSAVGATLETISERYRGRPVAGILLFTDGNTTDRTRELRASAEVPPIYPVVLGAPQTARDIRIRRVAVSQTNFEASPVTIAVEADSVGYRDGVIVFQLLDLDGRELQRQTMKLIAGGEPMAHRFLLQPEKPGVSFVRVRVFARQDEAQLDHPSRISEATLENNSRLVAVDRGGGPYRVLYVSGRPNPEYKFLRRGLQEDEEVDLVGLLRIARKEPKFTFRGHLGESTNPLFRGFDNQEDEEAEQYDQPVLLRLGVRPGGEELRDGFPKSAAELFTYHALIFDEIEAGFFTQDQLSLIQEFVSQRGGGFLMLGGKESFHGGDYARTPIGELLPVYLDRPGDFVPGDGYQLGLTRDGWLQPWTRLRTNERDETQRFAEMPPFYSLNAVRSIKPGATVLAHVTNAAQEEYPALVVQPFGKGRSAALLVGDLWRWNLKRRDASKSDLEKSWRQTVRWLVADVPARVGVEIEPISGDARGAVRLTATVRDEEYLPFDNAKVEFELQPPSGKPIQLSAELADNAAGQYEATFTPREAGAYRGQVIARGVDGSEIGRRELGWASEPATLEFERLPPDRELLERLAKASGGEVVEPMDLAKFVSSLPNRKVPITEPWVYPLWHQWSVLIFAFVCLTGEWGLRRWRGMP